MNEKNMTKIMEFNQVEQTIEILGHKIDKSYESWEAFLEEMKRLTLVQNNWNELKNYLEKQIIDSKSASSQQYYFNTIYKLMQELEQGKDD